MKRKHVFMLAALVLVAAMGLGNAFAADKGGFYVGVKGGYEYKDKSGDNVSDSAAAATNNNATNTKWSDKSGWAVGGAVGYNFAGMGLPVRAEAEYLYHNEFKYSATNSTTGSFSSKIDIHTVFANFFYDIKTSTAFTPYVGAGLGIAWINQKVASTFTGWTPATHDGNYDTTSFAWNVGAGVGYALTDNITVDLGYRYTRFGDAKKVENGNIKFQGKDLDSHAALLGLRYQF